MNNISTVTVHDLEGYNDSVTRISSCDANMNFTLLLFCSELKKIKKYNFKNMNRALQKKKLNLLKLYLDCEELIKLMKIFSGLECKELKLIMLQDTAKKTVYFTEKECRTIFRNIENMKTKSFSIQLEVFRIRKSFTTALIGELKALPDTVKLNDLFLEVAKETYLKECGLESHEVLNQLSKFNSIGVNCCYDEVSSKLNTKLMFVHCKKIALWVKVPQFLECLWFLLRENTSELRITFQKVLDLTKFVPICFVERQSKKLVVQVSGMSEPKKNRTCFKALLKFDKCFYYDEFITHEHVYPVNEKETSFLTDQDYFRN